MSGNGKPEAPKKSLRGRPETGKDQKYVRELGELMRIFCCGNWGLEK